MIDQPTDNLLHELSKRVPTQQSPCEPRSEDEQTTASLFSEDNSSSESNAVLPSLMDADSKLGMILRSPVLSAHGKHAPLAPRTRKGR
jgi:hypothetical protein